MSFDVYARSRQRNVHCPECGEGVLLLSAGNLDLPAFHICLGGGCGWVGLVGLGTVPERVVNQGEE